MDWLWVFVHVSSTILMMFLWYKVGIWSTEIKIRRNGLTAIKKLDYPSAKELKAMTKDQVIDRMANLQRETFTSLTNVIIGKKQED